MDPLISFSRYLAGRNAVLLAMAREILGLLDACDSGEAPARGRASDLMWLWTLGAYEVVRTMCQARVCFSARFFRAAAELKLDLERVRVPSTKMERIKYNRRDRSIPVASEREADLWDWQNRDLRVGDPADAVSARMLLAEYAAVMSTLTAEDVLASHEASLGGRQG
jgi:hypothetical protein